MGGGTAKGHYTQNWCRKRGRLCHGQRTVIKLIWCYWSHISYLIVTAKIDKPNYWSDSFVSHSPCRRPGLYCIVAYWCHIHLSKKTVSNTLVRNIFNQAWGQVQGNVLESKYKYITILQVQVQVQHFNRVLESKYKYFGSSTSTSTKYFHCTGYFKRWIDLS